MNIVLTPSALEEVVRAYSQVDAFAFDVETMDLSPKPDGFEDMPAKEKEQYDRRADPRRNQIVWIGLATYGRVDIIPMGHPNGELLRVERPLLATGKTRQAKGLPLRDNDYSRDQKKWINVFDAPPEQLTPAEVWEALAPLFHHEGVTKVAHNAPFDLQSSVKYLHGLPARPYHCTRTATFVLDSRHKNATGLDDVVAREFGYKMEKGVGARIEKHSFHEVAQYLFRDVRYTWLLYRVQKPRLRAEKAQRAFNLDMDVQEVVCKMEMAGALVDVEALEDLRDTVEYDIDVIRGKIYRVAGRSFNINSNQEKQALLWGPKPTGRGLKPRILTPGGKKKRQSGIPLTVNDYAVSEEALEIFEGQDELIDLLREYADLNKLMTTYVTPYLGGEVVRTTAGKERVENRVSLLNNGRVHTTFSLISADTGRFSSKNPNLQNIPNPRTPLGKKIRNAFIAPEGYRLVVADYSQIEPRVIASFSEDKTLIASYLNGEDIYTTIGSPFGVDRAGGKVLVLSLSYGVGPEKVAASLKVSVDRAKQILRDFEHHFPAVTEYKKTIIRDARARKPVPYVTTIMGRRRYLPDLALDGRENYGFRSRAERQAFNTRIQGSAADIIKLAMIRADRMIPNGAYLSLTVHDEIVTVTPADRADLTAEAIRQAMEGIQMSAMKVPLIADVKVVDRWGDAK